MSFWRRNAPTSRWRRRARRAVSHRIGRSTFEKVAIEHIAAVERRKRRRETLRLCRMLCEQSASSIRVRLGVRRTLDLVDLGLGPNEDALSACALSSYVTKFDKLEDLLLGKTVFSLLVTLDMLLFLSHLISPGVCVAISLTGRLTGLLSQPKLDARGGEPFEGPANPLLAVQPRG